MRYFQSRDRKGGRGSDVPILPAEGLASSHPVQGHSQRNSNSIYLSEFLKGLSAGDPFHDRKSSPHASGIVLT